VASRIPAGIFLCCANSSSARLGSVMSSTASITAVTEPDRRQDRVEIILKWRVPSAVGVSVTAIWTFPSRKVRIVGQ